MFRISRLILVVAVVFAMVTGAFADTVTLKSGKVYEGEIIEQTDDIVIIRVTSGTIQRDLPIYMDDVEEIKTGDEVGDIDVEVKPDRPNRDAETSDPVVADPASVDLYNKKVFVIPMHEGVGTFFRQDKLQEAIDAVRHLEPDVIVLEIDSPGGALSEVYKLSEYLSEVRDEFRVVAWIKSAISAAAMTAMNCREIYFMREGHIGAATAWRMNNGQAEALRGPGLDQWMNYAFTMSEDAGYNGYIAHAMIDKDIELSCDIEELPNGERRITWYNDIEAGEHKVCNNEDVLTFTAEEALKYGLSLGTADNEDELARLLNLDGWVEVSSEGREIMEAWWNTVETAETEIPRLLVTFQQNEGLLGSVGTERGRRRLLGENAEIIRELIQWTRRCEPIATWNFGLRERELQRQLREIIRQMDR